ncbi:MAG TPA: holo-ACP synthase [Armatimonadota bacterium]|nr:holo-ACP synthase [Armatimonadota bacterium]
MIDGIGVDIIEIERVAKAVARPRFRERVFTEAEREYCDAATNAERYAGRFAAKEAIAKALGIGLNWRDVEILCGESGAPLPRLHGAAAQRLGNRRLLISISHCRTYAVAQAVVEADSEERGVKRLREEGAA